LPSHFTPTRIRSDALREPMAVGVAERADAAAVLLLVEVLAPGADRPAERPLLIAYAIIARTNWSGVGNIGASPDCPCSAVSSNLPCFPGVVRNSPR
jgi:hypothetical protein